MKMGSDWQPNGYEANQAAVQASCDELLVQDLITQPLDAATVFSEFQQIMDGPWPIL